MSFPILGQYYDFFISHIPLINSSEARLDVENFQYYEYVPTKWIGYIFVILFGISTGTCLVHDLPGATPLILSVQVSTYIRLAITDYGSCSQLYATNSSKNASTLSYFL